LVWGGGNTQPLFLPRLLQTLSQSQQQLLQLGLPRLRQLQVAIPTLPIQAAVCWNLLQQRLSEQ
jgi:hypothetical protein